MVNDVMKLLPTYSLLLTAHTVNLRVKNNLNLFSLLVNLVLVKQKTPKRSFNTLLPLLVLEKEVKVR
jgi:hypothetical protein